MKPKSYPVAKRRILIERSVTDFIDFLQEVKNDNGKQFIRKKLLQNHVPGFREGRAPLTLTVPKLIAKLKNEQELVNCDSAVWEALVNAWMYWVKSHPELDDTLATFDNGADFDENHNCITPPNSELDIECFRFLLEASHNALIHKEIIRRFYEYGYFNEDKRIEDLVDKALPLKEVEQRRKLAALPGKIDELSQVVHQLSQTVTDLDKRISTLESTNELEQQLIQQIVATRESSETRVQKLEQKTVKQYELLNTRFSKVEANIAEIAGISEEINSIKSRISKLEDSLESFETKATTTESLNNLNQKITQLEQRMQEEIESFENRLNVSLDRAMAKLKADMNVPRVAYRASQIGEKYKAQLETRNERYSDENDYLLDFTSNLRKSGVTDSEETAAAIHVAMKAFPALEIPDARLMRIWRVMCSDHLYLTTIRVEMGWLGLQDWFPYLFSEECFKERLERVDLEISIKKMLELGDMPWMIYFLDCDRSFPESYLPSFLNWISEFCEGGIILFLMRCSGTNRCKTNEDFYERVARLPKPDSREPIESVNLRDSKILLRLSEWENWCRPNPDADSRLEKQFEFLIQLLSEIENRGIQFPIEFLPEIRHYLRLSYEIMAPTYALDWALTIRLLPWIRNRHSLIDAVQNLVNKENQELPHFQDGLQAARESDE